MSFRTRAVLGLAATLLAGCASTAVEQHYDSAQRLARERLGTELRWLRSDEARQQAQSEVDAALARPLSADDAARIALAYSPALQAALYENAAESAGATQSARLPNPVFAFERLARGDSSTRELELTRMLSVPVLDLLLLPARLREADQRQQQLQWRLASDVVQAALDARAAWVRAVAAEQSLRYAEQVQEAAEAGAELARRMEAVGNFSTLQRAREQAFSAEAAAQLARARQDANAAREALVRRLGLRTAQAAGLKLPERLPDLPAAPRDEGEAAQAALDSRLDLAQARAELDFSAREQGLARVTSVVNGLEIGAARKSTSGQAAQHGYELSLPLPLFDAGDASRAQAQARYMAAFERTAALAAEAESQVREAYAAYRSAYGLARHYRDEIVPLRKTIAEQNQLRYNAMQIGVFELLADAREQVAGVVQALDAQRDFWLADAALQAALIGAPTSFQREAR